MDTRFFLFASPFNWLIMLAVIAALWIAGRNVLRMRSQQETAAKVSSGLNSLLYASGAIILLGCLGYFMQMKSATCAQNVLPGSSFMTVITTVTDSAEHLRDLAACYIKGSAIMLAASAAALLLALVWFVLKNRLFRA